MTGNPRRRIPYPLPAYGRKCVDTEPVKLANTVPAVEASFAGAEVQKMCIRDSHLVYDHASFGVKIAPDIFIVGVPHTDTAR